jgi:hypothetical protein
VADSEGESPDFGELEPLGEELKPLDEELKPLGEQLKPLDEELKPLGEELKPLDEEAGESSLAGLEAEDLIPPDFESLLSSETVAPDAAEEPALETAPMVEVVAEDAGAATEKAEEPGAEGPAEEKPEEEPAEKEAKPAGKLMAYLDWVIAGGIAAGLLLLALVGLLNLSTAIYAVSVVVVVSAIWKARQTNDLYTVMLGCALVAILTAIYCLWLEVGRYRFDVKAREAKQRVSAPWLPGKMPGAMVGLSNRAFCPAGRASSGARDLAHSA